MTGYLYITFFCFSLAASKVLVGNMHYDNSLVIFVSFILTILIYGSFVIRHFSSFRRKIIRNFKYVVAINLATAGYWFFSYVLALQYIEAPLVLCIDLASASVFTFFFLTPTKEYKRNIPTILAIFCVVICMTIIAKHYRLKVDSPKNFFTGTGIAILAGLGNSCLSIFSKRLFTENFSVSEVISVRFLLSALLASVSVLWNRSWEGLGIADYSKILLSALLMSVLMVFLYQNSIQKLGPLVASTLMPFSPIIAYFMQIYMKGEACSYYVCGVIILCSFILALMNAMMKKEKKKRAARAARRQLLSNVS